MTENGLTYGHLFQARGAIARLRQLQFPPVTAVKAVRMLMALEPEYGALIEQYDKLIAAHGELVAGNQYRLDEPAIAAVAAEFDPLLVEPWPRPIEIALTLDELMQSSDQIAPETIRLLEEVNLLEGLTNE